MSFLDDVEKAKGVKQRAIEEEDSEYFYPMIFPYRDGKLFGIVTCKSIDKFEALNICNLMRVSFATSMTLILDGYMKRLGTNDENEARKAMENYRAGELQRKAEQEGALETGEVVETLTCLHMDDSGCQLYNSPYVHERGSKMIFWRPDWGGEMQAEGNIADAMRKIFETKPLIDSSEELKRTATIFKFEPERERFHCGRAAFHIMKNEGHTVEDFISHEHPEWFSED